MKHKKPDHCAGCIHHHRAGHPKGSRLHGSKFDNWCREYSNLATKAVGRCRMLGGKQLSRSEHEK